MLNSQDLTDAKKKTQTEENRLTHNPSTPIPPEISLLAFKPIEIVIILGLISGHA